MNKKNYKVIIFDMDGTLIEEVSSWNSIHKYFGVENSRDLKKYKEGKISYEEFMRRDINKWPKIHISKIEKIFLSSELKVVKGSKKAAQKLKERGYKIGLVSAGLDVLADKVGGYLGVDYILANGLKTDGEGNLTGEGVCRVELLKKDKVLVDLSKKLNIPLSKFAAVGDSEYDIPMLKMSGFGVAFNPRDEKIKKVADVVIEDNDIGQILAYL